VALDVVLANGSHVHTTATQRPDLFFALRGAADSFGIITYFYLQTRPAPSSIVTFTAQIPDVYKDPSALAVLLPNQASSSQY
jgi:FAD/FMN-containing dehydrogenase